ncbi:MAG: hypothetical protein NTU63_03085 [Candidatus Pacearchaeota archaeon]|nr:hypothetical protein [Candidatus Pacearchaeota archaeon]
MQGFEEKLQKAVSDLTERVKQHQGQVAFCLREFSVSGETTGDFIPPMSDDSYYYETGIINGEMQKNENSKMNRIDLPDFKLRKGGEDRPHHYIGGYYSIPVDRKLKGFVNSFRDGFQFDIKDLEELKQGNLLIDLRDFEEVSNALSFLFHDRTSHLTRADILIGDEEVGRFLSERKIKNVQELFEILQDETTTKSKIFSYYYDERMEFGEKLTITANEVANMFRGIRGLEESVMRASLSLEYEDGHSYPKWDDLHRGSVEKYLGLKEVVLKKIKVLNQQLEEGKKLYAATNLPMIKGEVIGIPTEIAFSSYSLWLEDSVSGIRQTLNKIDGCLSEERQKTNSR